LQEEFYTIEAVAKLRASRQPMILSQVERKSEAFPYLATAGLPERVGEEPGTLPGSKVRRMTG